MTGGTQVAQQINGVSSALQRTNQQITTSGNNVATMGREFTATVNPIKNSGNALNQFGANADKVTQKSHSMSQGVASTARSYRGLIFGVVGLTSSLVEALGMWSIYMDAETRVKEAQAEVNRLTAEGKQGTDEMRDAVNELAGAERALNMVRRNTILSFFDMVTWISMTINGLTKIPSVVSKVKGAFDTLTGSTTALSAALGTTGLAGALTLVGGATGGLLLALEMVRELEQIRTNMEAKGFTTMSLYEMTFGDQEKVNAFINDAERTRVGLEELANTPVLGTIHKTFNAIGNAFIYVGEALYDLAITTLPTWWNGFITDIGTLGNAAWDNITTGLKGIADALTTIANLPQTAFDRLKGLFGPGGADNDPATPWPMSFNMNTSGQEMSEFGPVTKVPALDTTAIEVSIDELIEKIQLAFILIKNQIAFDVQVISQIISIGFSQAVINVPLIFDELLEKIQLSFILIQTLTMSTVTAMILEFGRLSIEVPIVMDELIEKTQMTFTLILANAINTVTQIESAFDGMIEQLSDLFDELASNWSSTMNSFINNAESAADGVSDAMDDIVSALEDVQEAAEEAAEAIRDIPDAPGRASGGVISRATGGLMSAAGGRFFTANGDQTIRIGDNPGGRESVAFIPHNNPGPTLEKIARMFGGFGESRVSVNRGSSSVSVGHSGTPIIQVFLDGKQVKGAVVQMLASNQSALK